ncbi:P-loop containing nucleoside triphosphate hydrolase protein [Thelephora terrestris]|uniref:P-loop containing nucleoside triphosphate hydrolase protein n=1 Tax=Thelephora terrestris TaxID=56493 RepID=A0A9P6LBH8_9AGAM|nr:P-loop containing nucleoside triphosphate hydrolase protein [Thelephora terrestris]
MRMFLMTASNVIGAFVLIAVIIPWFLVAVGAILIAYYFLPLYYRASARELKQLDAILRSSLHAHFSESLTGLATIRAYGETDRFRKESEERVNTENRAYWLTITNQRWLGMRVEILGLLLTFVVARFTISPAQTGVTLIAKLENDRNSVERIMHYADERKPQAPWPGEGHVEIRDVVLRYRPELPDVLRGLTMDVAPGEKIGIVGRTGAGKSSIMTALYRLVELSAGSIVIDGVDISEIGLKDLRSALAIIPQDKLLFSGTLRSNLDPFDQFDDAKLWDAFKRSYLVEEIKTQGTVVEGEAEADGPKRFSLDTVIEDEGSNLSVGQRSLVSLARALVKDTRVLILDEATASVDYETDRKIQDTIATEFEDRTILCIAHRLQTIIGYDRICVMDAGRIAEFDTPTRLYHMEDGIFRGMCDRSQISLQDIRRAAKLREL